MPAYSWLDMLAIKEDELQTKVTCSEARLSYLNLCRPLTLDQSRMFEQLTQKRINDMGALKNLHMLRADLFELTRDES
jgi:hypothetical protein